MTLTIEVQDLQLLPEESDLLDEEIVALGSKRICNNRSLQVCNKTL